MINGVHWHLVHTLPNNETRAARSSPPALLSIFRAFRGGAATAPRRHCDAADLSGNLFVRFDLARDQWRSVQSTFGVSALVFVGEKPAALSNHVIDEIRARENPDGFVMLRLPAGLNAGTGAPNRRIVRRPPRGARADRR